MLFEGIVLYSKSVTVQKEGFIASRDLGQSKEQVSVSWARETSTYRTVFADQTVFSSSMNS